MYRIGQHVTEHHGQRPPPQGQRRLDEACAADRQGLRTHQACITWHRGDAHGEDQVGGALAEQGDDHQCQQQVGKCQQHIHCAHQQVVQPHRREACQQPKQGAQPEAHRSCRQADKQRRACTVNQPAKHITAVLIGAQPERCARWLIGQTGIGQQRVGRRQPAGQRHCQQQQAKHRPGQA
ncbi:hypothetical protein D3C76_1270250 [compost metagenome]